MEPQPPYPVAFKYRPVTAGRAAGFTTKKGMLFEERLVLDKESMAIEEITSTTVRDSRLFVVRGQESLVIEVYGIKALRLEKLIDRLASQREVERVKRELEARGESNKFRAITCPCCGAAINLSGYSRTRYAYCRFCESILDADGRNVVTSGILYKHCDECQSFDRIKAYTEFYFYFLLVVYGFRYQRRFICGRCANRLFVKTFLINLLFLLGIVPAIAIKIKSHIGRDERFRGLPKANALALRGRHQEADMLYANILRAHDEHPGILLNQAMGHLRGGDVPGAVSQMERSLAACSNYEPTVRTLSKLAEVARAA